MDPIFIMIVMLMCLGFVSIGVWGAIQGTRPQLPPGVSTPIPWNNTLVHRAAGVQDIIIASVYGYWLSTIAGVFERVIRLDAKRALNGMIVLIMDDAGFEEMRVRAGLTPSTVAFQTYATQTFGRGPFMIVLKASANKRGRLVVHETIHAMCTAAGLSVESNHMHRDERIWNNGIEGEIITKLSL